MSADYYVQGCATLHASPREIAIMRCLIEEVEKALKKIEEDACDEEISSLMAREICAAVQEQTGYCLKDRTQALLSSFLRYCDDNASYLLDPALYEETSILMGCTEHFEPGLTAELMHIAVSEFDLPPVTFTYARAATELIDGEFAGSGCIVRSEGVKWFDIEAVLARNVKSTLAEKVARGSLDEIKRIVASGVDLDQDDSRALRWAVRSHRADVVAYLLEQGAQPDVPGIAEFSTPEIEAIRHAWILRRKVDPQYVEVAEPATKIAFRPGL